MLPQIQPVSFTTLSGKARQATNQVSRTTDLTRYKTLHRESSSILHEREGMKT
jgi:hypothetical protein